MFYRPDDRDKTILPHDPFKAIVAPRPIGWVSTLSAAGDLNLAPYSFFNAFADRPPILGFSSAGYKDSLAFIEETRQFVWNLPSFPQREAMNQTSTPLERGRSEPDYAGIAMAPSHLVKPPRVADSPAALECELIEVKRLTDRNGTPVEYWLVLGEVVGVHLDERYIRDGRVDMTAMQPLARCGYMDYVVADRPFAMGRPEQPEAEKPSD